MKDQAARLREIVAIHQGQHNGVAEGRGRFIAIMSGKGGTGKSYFSVQFAALLAREGFRILLVDANLTTPSLHILFNASPTVTVRKVLEEKSAARNLSLLPVAERLDLFPNEETEPFPSKPISHNVMALLSAIRPIQQKYDYIILDTQTGINEWNVSIMQTVSPVFLLSFVEPTAIIDTYTFLKASRLFVPVEKFFLVFNQVMDINEGKEAHSKLNMALEHFLKFTVPLSGLIPFDVELKQAIARQEPFWEEGFDSAARQDVEKIVTEFIQLTPASHSSREG